MAFTIGVNGSTLDIDVYTPFLPRVRKTTASRLGRARGARFSWRPERRAYPH